MPQVKLHEPLHPLLDLVRKDRRYDLEAYLFVFEALQYGQRELGLGADQSSDTTGDDPEEDDASEARQPARHLTGQELCEAIRQYALEQFGYMAKTVLESWGVRNTGDFGEIVYNLIRIRQMRKTPHDRREDFDDVFDFEEGLCRRFQIGVPQ
jgi:uncharacterized repeat protein (TIGR04138 family)